MDIDDSMKFERMLRDKNLSPNLPKGWKPLSQNIQKSNKTYQK
jgi:hypothetical protein